MPPQRAPTHHSAIHSVLDGFRLLHRAQVRNPSEVYRVDIQGQQLDKVVENDLLLFTNLYSLNANENRLSLQDLSFLPQLRDLRIVQNNIPRIPPQVAFHMPLLTTLDISFNNLDQESIAVLAALPNLHMLDMSHCGLTSVPIDIANMNAWWSQFDEINKAMVLPGFLKLESLNLSNNKIKDGSLLLSVLRCMPNLLKLELQNNQIESLAILQSSAQSTNAIGFQKLEELDVSSNAISTPEGIMGIAWLARIKHVFIANNPITQREESQIEINDYENGEVLGHIAFNPFSILQDVYGINVKDAPVGRKRMKAVKAGPYQVKEESERLSGIKKYALKDEDIVRMLECKYSGSVADTSVAEDFPGDIPEQITSAVDRLVSAVELDGTFITSVPILETRKQSMINNIRSLIPKNIIDSTLIPLTPDELAISLPNTVPASVKALRLALETPASFWRISRYTKSVVEYQEMMRGIKEDKKTIKVDMSTTNHKWAKAENESLHKLMQAIDDKLAIIDGKMDVFRLG